MVIMPPKQAALGKSEGLLQPQKTRGGFPSVPDLRMNL